MTERPPPTEAEQRQPEPLRIFSGARINPDGRFVSPIHQALSDLWKHEARMGRIPGQVRTMFAAGSDVETTVSLRVIPHTQKDYKILEKTRSRFERGVSEWIQRGASPYSTISEFREAYITPLDLEDHDFHDT